MSTPTPPESSVRPEATAAGGSAATLTLVYWLLSAFVFHGEVPPEVSSFVFIGLPWLGAYVGAVMARRRRLKTGRVAPCGCSAAGPKP